MAVTRAIQIVSLVLIFSIYAAFATHSYYWDGVSFALTIENVYSKTAPFGALFHPNHLLYNLVGYCVFSGLRALGLMVRALWVLQCIDIALSVCCGYVVFRIAEFSFRSVAVAYTCWFLFAFGALWWEFSTNADAYVIATLFLALAFLCLLKRGVRSLPIVCILHVLAMVLHELSIFFLVPVLASIWLEAGMTMGRRVVYAVSYCAAAALLVGSVYYFCFLYAPHAAGENLLSWAGSHAEDARFTYSLTNNIVVNGLSYVKLFFGGKLSFIYDYLSVPTVIALVVTVLSIISSVVLFSRLKAQAKTPAPHFWLALSWVLPYAMFLSVWLPRNGFYKLFIWPPIVLLLGHYLSQRPWAIAGATALLAATIGWNFAAYVYPRSHDSATPVVEFAKKLNSQLPRGAVLYYRSFVPDDWYLRYFTPGTEWKPFNGPYPALLPTNSRACFETTALALPAAQLPRLGSKYKWDLVSAKYNVRVQCTD